MDSLLINLEAIVPTFLAIMSLVLFTPKTRWFSYSIILLAIGTELIPLTVNITALMACAFCFVGLLVREYQSSTHHSEKRIFNKRRHS